METSSVVIIIVAIVVICLTGALCVWILTKNNRKQENDERELLKEDPNPQRETKNSGSETVVIDVKNLTNVLTNKTGNIVVIQSDFTKEHVGMSACGETKANFCKITDACKWKTIAFDDDSFQLENVAYPGKLLSLRRGGETFDKFKWVKASNESSLAPSTARILLTADDDTPSYYVFVSPATKNLRLKRTDKNARESYQSGQTWFIFGTHWGTDPKRDYFKYPLI